MPQYRYFFHSFSSSSLSSPSHFVSLACVINTMSDHKLGALCSVGCWMSEEWQYTYRSPGGMDDNSNISARKSASTIALNTPSHTRSSQSTIYMTHSDVKSEANTTALHKNNTKKMTVDNTFDCQSEETHTHTIWHGMFNVHVQFAKSVIKMTSYKPNGQKKVDSKGKYIDIFYDCELNKHMNSVLFFVGDCPLLWANDKLQVFRMFFVSSNIAFFVVDTIQSLYMTNIL